MAGRPPKEDGNKYSTPARQAGRIPDDEWAMIKRAAALKGYDGHTQAIRAVLVRWAKRVIREHGD